MTPEQAAALRAPSPYYSDESVTLWHGDCREITGWLAADVLVTDPPYGRGWRQGALKLSKSDGHRGIAGDDDTAVRDAALALCGLRELESPGAGAQRVMQKIQRRQS